MDGHQKQPPMARLRRRYGRMYNFEEARPISIRLLAGAIQPALPNR